MNLHWTKLAPGLYELNTGIGRYEANRVDPLENKGYSKATVWYLTYPGESHPDTVTSTLKDAKAAAEADYLARLNESLTN